MYIYIFAVKHLLIWDPKNAAASPGDIGRGRSESPKQSYFAGRAEQPMSGKALGDGFTVGLPWVYHGFTMG